MPYSIVEVGTGKYAVVDRESGRVHSFGTSLTKAKEYARTLIYSDYAAKRASADLRRRSKRSSSIL